MGFACEGSAFSVEMLAGLGRKENVIKEAGYPTESLVGWRKELEAKLLGKMPQTTLQAWPHELAATLPSLLSLQPPLPSAPVQLAIVSSTLHHHPQSWLLLPPVTSTEPRRSLTWHLWLSEPTSSPSPSCEVGRRLAAEFLLQGAGIL